MADLFNQKQKSSQDIAPLATRLRPRSLEEFIGQEHILGKRKPLRRMIEKGKVSSMILWGPPGCGKTTLALLIADYTKSVFEQFSAVTAGVEDVRQIIRQAKERLKYSNKRTILFVDEIHRFNKAQQDAFLPYVESGLITLIGATTENPGFEVNAPLISRCQVVVLEPLKNQEIDKIVERGLKEYPTHKFEKKAIEYIVRASNGDARVALNALELACLATKNITLKIAQEAVRKKAIYYDKYGDFHYDTISAFIKSIRGSDPDAALYWLARMIGAGEDPLFIARRMVILAAEDIGNASPTALVLATSCMQAVHMVGMPEAGIILAQTTCYLATCPKSNAAYKGITSALRDIEKERLEPVPLHLRNAPTFLAKKLGHGKDYKYPHNFPAGWVKENYLPKNLLGKIYYQPKEIGQEKFIKRKLDNLRKQKGPFKKILDNSCPKGLGG